jgi:hypothetical protein
MSETAPQNENESLSDQTVGIRVAKKDYEFLANLEGGKRSLFLRDAIGRAIQSLKDGEYPKGWDKPNDFLTDPELAKKHGLDRFNLHHMRKGSVKMPSRGKYYEVIKNYIPGDKGWYPKER